MLRNKADDFHSSPLTVRCPSGTCPGTASDLCPSVFICGFSSPQLHGFGLNGSLLRASAQNGLVPSPATAATRRANCNRDSPPPLAQGRTRAGGEFRQRAGEKAKGMGRKRGWKATGLRRAGSTTDGKDVRRDPTLRQNLAHSAPQSFPILW